MSVNEPGAADRVGLLIDGRLSESSSDEPFQGFDPSTGAASVVFPAGSSVDVDRAVASCRRVVETGAWADLPPSHRKKILYRFADLVAADAGSLDRLDALDMGKPISEPFGNAAAAAGLIRFNAEALDKLSGDVFVSDQHSLGLQRRVPRGVVAALIPWNFPAFVTCLKVAPALAAGNAVVLKPSEYSSRSALRIAHLGLEAGLPPGALNVTPGVGDTVGKALGLHPDVDMLTFTGSTAVGKLMLQYAGQSNMKVVLAECGGKSPHIVFADTPDLDAVANAVARQFLTNQGQVCSIGSRLLVERSIANALVEKIAERMTSIVMGPAISAETNFGPIVSKKQCDRVMDYIAQGKASGADLVIGGRRALTETGGYFVEPTIFQNVSPEASISQEEIFGPVLAVMPFDTEDDAVSLANGTKYGLIAYVWTADLSRAMRLMKRIPVSMRINAVAPMGEGYGFAGSNEPRGQSGVGTEGGLAGLEGYMRRQLVAISHG